MSQPVVAITRPYDRAQPACEIVKNLGGQCVFAPTLDLKPINSESLKELIARIDELDWIVFTSPTTLVSMNKFYPDELKSLSCKIAVIGRKTAEEAKKYGLTADLIPKDYTAEGLVEEFKNQNIKNQIIGVPRTKSARNTLPEGLKELGNEVILAEAYKSLFPMNEDKIKDLINKIENKEIDAITFTSPLTVENFFKIAIKSDELANLLSNNLLTVAIGPITGKILDNYNVSYIYPDTYTVKDMMELLFKTWRIKNE